MPQFQFTDRVVGHSSFSPEHSTHSTSRCATTRCRVFRQRAKPCAVHRRGCHNPCLDAEADRSGANGSDDFQRFDSCNTTQHREMEVDVLVEQVGQVSLAQVVQKTVAIPETPVFDRAVNVPSVTQRQVPTTQKTVEIPLAQFIHAVAQRQVPTIQKIQITVDTACADHSRGDAPPCSHASPHAPASSARCRRSSSTKWLTFQLCNRDMNPQCRQKNRTAETHMHTSWTLLLTRPLFVYPTSLISLFRKEHGLNSLDETTTTSDTLQHFLVFHWFFLSSRRLVAQDERSNRHQCWSDSHMLRKTSTH